MHRTDNTHNGLIVVHNYYYARPGFAEAVYRWRLHACEVRAQLGFPRGDVLRGLRRAETWPDVIWTCTYPSLEARHRDAEAVTATPEFQAVMRHMRTLIQRFERRVWRAYPRG